MPNPRAFISFDYDNDQNEKELFAGQIKNSRTPFYAQDWSAKASMPQSQWERIVEEKIKKCNMVIVLVGSNTIRATGVNKEIEMAKRNNVPVFGVYIHSSYCDIPRGLINNRVVKWKWDQIASAIDSAMLEGKNRY